MRYIECRPGLSTEAPNRKAAIMKFPEFTSIDFSKLDINALRKIDLSKYVPDIDLPAIDTEKLTAALRDAGYLAVGIGVAAVEQTQVAQRQLIKAISDRYETGKTAGKTARKSRVETLRSTVEANMTRLDERINAAEARVDTLVERIEGVLPQQAGVLFGQVRDISKVARKQVRGLLTNAA